MHTAMSLVLSHVLSLFSVVFLDLICPKPQLFTPSAKKNIYVIGGSKRELGSAWTRSECTYQVAGQMIETLTGSSFCHLWRYCTFTPFV